MPGAFADRVVVVTGASRGIGNALARALGAEGAHVIAVGRTTGALEALDDAIRAKGGKATLVPVDLTDYAAIDRLGAALFQRHQRLDAVVGNAGVLGELTPVGHIDPKMWDEVMAVNLTVNWRLIRSFDPLLRLAPAGRAVFVTASVARQPRPFWGAYAASKAALEAIAAAYAEEIRDTPVRVNLFDPGATRTRMRAKAMPGEDPATLPTPEKVAAAILPMLLPDWTENGRLVKYRD
ncbi:MAG TPA: SDR family NAD(P)-dependent oxidoreductase [Hyphomicrobiales bacterium]|nr:SDR family NAD(P)-dependent oxidoreductase [Hyphomicrobiales bacterium]